MKIFLSSINIFFIFRFKKDMISVKKLLKMFDIIDISEYLSKIDSINKQILPKALLRKKKTEDVNN